MEVGHVEAVDEEGDSDDSEQRPAHARAEPQEVELRAACDSAGAWR